MSEDAFAIPNPAKLMPNCCKGLDRCLMDRPRSWKCRDATLHYVCLLDTTVELYEADESILSPILEQISFVKPWRVYRFRSDPEWYVSLYRKRLILSHNIPIEAYTDVDEVIRKFLDKRTSAEALLNDVSRTLKLKRILYYPVIAVKNFRSEQVRKSREEREAQHQELLSWLDDRVTTFSLRIFNVLKPRKVSYVRVSRHLLITYGVSRVVFQEVVNLVHEKLLYNLLDKNTLEAQDIFDLLDGLAKYTLPTELNLVLYEVVAKISFYLATVAALLVMLVRSLEGRHGWEVVLGFVIWAIVSGILYFLLQKIHIYSQD